MRNVQALRVVAVVMAMGFVVPWHGVAAVPTGPLAYVRVATGVVQGVRAMTALGVDGPSLAAGALPLERPMLALGFDDRLEIGHFGRDGRWQPATQVGIAQGVTALASRPGGFLAVGTGGAGLVMIVPVPPLSVGSPRAASGYLFGGARGLWWAELNGSAPPELVALNAQGELFLYAAGAGGGGTAGLSDYRRTWRSPPGSSYVRVAVADMDRDGVDEVATAAAGGRIELWRWQGQGQLEPVASVFPWGEVQAMGADPATGRLVVVTAQRLLYAYRLDAGQLVAATQVYDDRLALRWMRVVSAPATQATARAVVEGAGPSGVQVFLLSEAGTLRQLAGLAWPGDSPAFERLATGRLALLRPSGEVDLLDPVAAGFLAVTMDGQAVRPAAVVWEQDQPLVAVDELARLAGLWVHRWDASSAWLVGTGVRARVEVGVATVQGDTAAVSLPVTPRQVNDQLYVPFQVLVALGWQVEYQPPYRRLTIQSPTGAG